MPSDIQPHGICVTGTRPDSQYVLERLSLRCDFAVISQSAESGTFNGPAASVVYFAGAATFDRVVEAIQSGRHIVLESARGLGATDLNRLAEFAHAQQTLAVIDQRRRWDEDFVNARTVFDRGILGPLERIRLAVHDHALPTEGFPNGVLHDLGYHWLDQLLVFASRDVTSVQLQRDYAPGQANDVGFLLVLNFADGISAVVELQTHSLLSLRTGWLLEGTTGAYRAGRQYTQTVDGEIIDEPVSRPPAQSDPFFDVLSAALNGDRASLAWLPDMSHAARVARLMDRLEHDL
ncbi:MAG: hypothetical protein JSS49_21845 [Planctomycetes bacterium]|nr:hypothetical protein [Planctomycetota bacterium]